MKRFVVGAALAVLAVVTGADAAAGQVGLLKDGRLGVDNLAFELSVFTRQWQHLGSTGSGGTFQVLAREKKGDSENIRYRVNFPGAAPGELTVSVRERSPESVEASYKVKLEAPSEVNFLCIMTALPISQYSGDTFKVDGKEWKFPLEYNGEPMVAGTCRRVKEFQFRGADGMVTFRGDFYLHLQDGRAWNGSTYGLRIGFVPHNGTFQESELKFTLTRKLVASRPLDLRGAATVGFADEVNNDGKGGWTDQGRENDLRSLPVGRQLLQGVLFEILDPAKNGGKSCIVLKGRERPRFPAEVVALQSGKESGNYLYLLHALAYVQGGEPAGKVIVEYADGKTTELEVRPHRDVGDWWRARPVPGATVAWTGANPQGSVGLFSTAFPIQKKPVKALRFISAGNAVWGIVAATLTDEKSPSRVLPPYYSAEGRDWKAMRYNRDVKPGSALDFSGLLDAPAGKYGPVTIDAAGRFVFRDRPDRPVRFYGTNFVGDAQFLEKEWAERLADRIARLGFNAVRFHHHDNTITNRDKVNHGRTDTTEPLPEMFDRLDYFIDCLRKRGIYYTTDVYVSRRSIPASELPELGGIETPGEYKALFYIDDTVYANWEKWARNFFGHVNPYTGLAMKDDPALVALNLVNEGNPGNWWNSTSRSSERYQRMFQEWLEAEKLRPKDGEDRERLFQIFLGRRAEIRYAQMKQFIRNLGCKVPLSDQNFRCEIRLSVERDAYDYVDNHSYWDHPRFAEKRWQLPVLPAQAHPLKRADGVPGLLFPTRLFGKPFTVTEFDYAYPNRFRAMGPAFMAAYAAFQGWDGLWQFAYSHSRYTVVTEGVTSGFFDIGADLSKTFSQRIGARIFLAGGIAPAPDSFAVAVGNAEKLAAGATCPVSVSELGFVARVGTVVSRNGKLDSARLPQGIRALIDVGDLPQYKGKVPVLAAGKSLVEEAVRRKLLPASCYDSATRTLTAPTGQLSLGLNEGTLRIAAPGAEVLALPAGKSLTGKRLSVRNRVGDATFAALPNDTVDLGTARRIVLMHLTNTMASGMKFANAGLDRLESWGKAPFLVQRGEAEVTFRAEGNGWKLYALDSSGERIGEIPVKAGADGALTFRLSTIQEFGAVCAYELTR